MQMQIDKNHTEHKSNFEEKKLKRLCAVAVILFSLSIFGLFLSLSPKVNIHKSQRL